MDGGDQARQAAGLRRIGDADFIGLPGNPVSGFVTLQTLVRPFLQKRMGLPLAEQAIQRYPAAFAWPKPDARRSEFLRVRRTLTDEGWQLELYPQQSSGALTSCAWADGLAWLEPGQTVAPGDSLRYWALDLA